MRFMLMILAGVLAASAQAAPNTVVKTKFGTLQTHCIEDCEGIVEQEILFNGNKIAFSGFSPFFLEEKTYPLGNRVVAIVSEFGGNGCPAMYQLLILSKNGVQKTKTFGNCSDLLKIRPSAKGLHISLPKFRAFLDNSGNLTTF